MGAVRRKWIKRWWKRCWEETAAAAWNEVKNVVGYKASSAKYLTPGASVFSSCPSWLIRLVHLRPLPVLIMCLCSHSPIHFLHFHIRAAQPPFPSLAHINCNLQRLAQLLVRSGIKDGWMICCVCVILCSDALFVWARARRRAHVCVRYDANRTSCLVAPPFWCFVL